MALIFCPECQKEISDQAAACPHCGMPRAANPPGVEANAPPSKAAAVPGCLWVAGAIVLLIVIGSVAGGGHGSVNSDVAGEMLAKREQCRQNVAALEGMGVKISDRDGASDVEYDEAVWAGMTHDDRIKQGLLVYCAKMPDDGHWTVMIYGLHDGQKKGSVVDGNWWD